MRTQRWAVLVFFTSTVFSFAQQKTESPKLTKTVAQGSAADDSARLPVKRVVLYKNGVGYFEHSTRVHGNQELAIDFTTAQLNDVLKSLTVVTSAMGAFLECVTTP